jgi:hypothetical protein
MVQLRRGVAAAESKAEKSELAVVMLMSKTTTASHLRHEDLQQYLVQQRPYECSSGDGIEELGIV